MTEDFLIIKNIENIKNKQLSQIKFDYRDEKNLFFFKTNKSKNSSYAYDLETGVFVFCDGFFIDEKQKSSKTSKEILSLYKKSGDKLFNKLDGFFSIIIFDPTKDELLLVNDHIGSGSIYFCKEAGSIFVSSSIKNLKNLLSINHINMHRVNTFFQFIHSKDNETFFSSIKQVQNGQYICFKKEEIRIVDYLSYNLKKYDHLKTEKEYAREFKNLFFKSVNSCMNEKKEEFATALSGGLDSSSITSAAAYLNNKKITAFTATFNSLTGKDLKKTYESNFSKDVSQKHNIDHKIIKILKGGGISYLDSNITKHQEPDLLINGYIHEEIFKELKSEKIQIFLDGYGGDAVISHGYNLFHELGKSFQLSKLFRQLNHLYKAKGAKLNYWKSIKEFVLSNHVPDYFHWLYKSNFGKASQQIVWSRRLLNKKISKSIYKNLKKAYGFYPLKFKKTAKYMHHIEMKNRLIGLSVRSIKELAKSYDVEIRFPFLSKSLIELSLCTPVDLKLKDGMNRYIFRKSMEGILPKSICDRNSKSDLSPLSKSEIENIEFDEIKKLAAAHCPDLFDLNYIKILLKNSDVYLFEVYQVYSFLRWLAHNDIRIE